MPTNQLLTFRLHGKFGLKSGFGNLQLPRGTLDILYMNDPAETVLRWRRTGGAGEAGDPVAAHPNWHSQNGLVWPQFESAATGGRDEVTLAIGRPDGAENVDPQALTLTGIIALDRIKETELADPRPSADLRIPCVTQGDAAAQNWLKVGRDQTSGDDAFVFAYQVAIPLPTGIGHYNNQARNHWLPLGGQHSANQPDAAFAQQPDFIFSPPNEDDLAILQDMSDRRRRFGSLELAHYATNGPEIHFHENLEVGNAQLVLGSGDDDEPEYALLQSGIVTGNTRDKWPYEQDIQTHHRITLSNSPNGLGLRVTARAQVGWNRTGQIYVDFKRQLGRKLPSAKKSVTVITTFDTVATDEALASGGDYDCEAALRLEFQTDPNTSADALTIRDADSWMERERAGLLETRAQPQSFLPSLSIVNRDKNVGVAARIAVRGRMSGGEDGLPKIDIDPVHGTAPPVVLTLMNNPDYDGDRVDSTVPLRINFPAAHIGAPAIGDNQAPPHLYHVRLGGDPRALDQAPERSQVLFVIENDDDLADSGHGRGHHTQPLRAQLGSLEFRGVAPGENQGVKLFPQGKTGSLALRPDPGDTKRHELDLLLRIALADARPVASDLPHGARDPLREDWLIPARKLSQDQSRETRFALEIKEKIGPQEDHHLVANLFKSSREGARGFDDVLVTRAPFAMMRLRRPALDVLASEASSNVATFDSDSRTWKFNSGGDLVPISFPASATGESMDKPGRRAISDRGADGEGAASPFVRSRLSGPATLWIDTTELGRNYRTPEHNARELFARWGEAGPGTELAGYVTELVYGLSTAWKRPRNTTALTSSVRVTETGTLMGRPVQPRDGTAANAAKLRERLPQLLQAIAERPQHLETVTRLQDRLTEFEPAVFSDGLTFAGRKTAVLAPPVTGVTSTPDEQKRIGPKVADHGLDGGAFWAIEQRAFAQEVLENPVSTEGRVENFTVGPFGAGGEQVARFVNGSLAIITLSRLGRLESLRVEIMGRISAFYHRAKHVVVYRRTTAASDQFEGLGGTSERPIMRKVEEFIDLQEPVRSYPDGSNLDPRTVGPFRELRFGTPRINVDSAWADEVGTSGWRVPLWNRHAASERPVVYPMPSITAACQGEDTERLTLQALCDPGKLYFYTNVEFAKAARDTNAWPAVHGVDGLDATDFDEWMRQQDEAAAGEKVSAARRPAASRFIPGAGGFTHCLAPSSSLTKVNEGRGDRPVFAALESFTFMRGRGRQTSADKPVKVEALKLPSEIDDFLDELEVPVPDPENRPLSLIALEAPTQALRDQIDALIESGQDNVEGAVRAQIDGLRTELEDKAADIKELAGAELAQLKQDIFGSTYDELKESLGEGSEAFDLLKEIAEADKADCEALRQQALTAIRAKKMLVLERLSGAQGQLLSELDREDITKAGLLARIKTLENQAKAIAGEAVGHLDGDIGNVAARVADARALVRDWGADLDRAYRNGLERVAGFRRSYDSSKPWSASRLDKAQQALTSQLANLTGEASAALSQTRQRLAGEISGRASDVTSVIDKTLRTARDQLQKGSPVNNNIPVVILTADTAKFEALLASVPVDTVADIATRLQAALDNTPLSAAQKEALEDAKAGLETLDRKVAKLREDAEALSNEQAKKIVEKIKTLAEEANAQVAALAADATGAVAELETDLQAELNRITGALSTSAGELRGAVENFDGAQIFDAMVDQADRWIKDRAGQIHDYVSDAQADADKWLGSVADEISTARTKLRTGLTNAITEEVITPVFEEVRAAIIGLDGPIQNNRAKALQAIGAINGLLTEKIDDIETVAGDITTELTKLCDALIERKRALLNALESVKAWAAQRLRDYARKLGKLRDATAAQVQDALNELGDVFDNLAKGVEELAETALTAAVRATERAADAVADYGKELADNIARMIAAGGKIPDIGNLGINTDRITAFFKDLVDDIDVSRVFSSLGGVGDALGAFKFELPVVGLGQGFDLPDLNLPDLNLPDLNFEDLLPNIAGINFKDIIPDFGNAGNSLRDLKKYVKITHDIDKKAKTAWAKAELDIAFPKRARLFGFGPFTLFLNKPDLTAWVRIETNAKTKEITTTEHGQIKTDMEAVVGGQAIVTLRDVLIVYTKDGGLDFDIDPKKIRLNPNFQFIQDILEGLGLDDGDNGLKLLKDDNGIPVGVEHKVAFPVPPVNAGTSGLVGLTIANAFQLKAYPDFAISNQFNLSTREKPFIFSIFVIGGTGFVQLDVDHLPTDGTMKILVTAGVGGSASLAFSFGPISGGVFITLSVIMNYHKYIGYTEQQDDEGLSVALELAIIGHVSLWGIATIFLRLGLSISYHESGHVDATGRLKVVLRISRFFKLKYSTTVKYRLRDGKSVTVRESSTSVEVPQEVTTAAERFKQARAQLS